MLRDAKRELGHFLASCYLVYGLNIHPFTSSHLLVLEHKVKGHKTWLHRFWIKWKPIQISRIPCCSLSEMPYTGNCFSLLPLPVRFLDIHNSVGSAWSKWQLHYKKIIIRTEFEIGAFSFWQTDFSLWAPWEKEMERMDKKHGCYLRVEWVLKTRKRKFKCNTNQYSQNCWRWNQKWSSRWKRKALSLLGASLFLPLPHPCPYPGKLHWCFQLYNYTELYYFLLVSGGFWPGRNDSNWILVVSTAGDLALTFHSNSTRWEIPKDIIKVNILKVSCPWKLTYLYAGDPTLSTKWKVSDFYRQWLKND